MAIETPPIRRGPRGIPAEALPQRRPDDQEPPIEAVAETGIDTPTVYPRRILQPEPGAFEQYRNGLKKRLAVGVLALAGIATALGGYAAINSGPKTGDSPSPSIPGATETVSSAPGTPRVEISPDHFPLNPKTVKESAILLYELGLPANKDFPFAYGMDLHAFTIEKVKQNSDGSLTITVDMNGGALIRSDRGTSVMDYGNEKQELYTYYCNADSTKPNTMLTINVPIGTSLLTHEAGDLGKTGRDSANLFTPGDATIDFRATPNGPNPNNVSALSTLDNSVGQNLANIPITATQIEFTNK